MLNKQGSGFQMGVWKDRFLRIYKTVDLTLWSSVPGKKQGAASSGIYLSV